MSQQLTVLNKFNRAYLRSLLQDLENDQLDLQPQQGLHSIRWILSHIAIVADYGLKQFALPFVCPVKWHAAYGPGSQAGTNESVKPQLDELLAAIEQGYSALCNAAESGSDTVLSEEHDVELLKNTPLKSKGDLIAHVLTTHFAVHLGQLSTICRLLGRPPLF